MHCHLVAVEVGVVCTTGQRVQSNRLTLDQCRFKCLNGKSVQRGGAVQQNRMLLGHLFQHVPYLNGLALNQFLGGSYGMHVAKFLEPPNDERLEQNQCHLLGQAALMQLQVRPDHDHGTAGVIHTLAEKILTEATALALEHIAQRLEGAVAGASDGATVATVVEQRVHCLLQHALLVSDDHLRCLKSQEVFQAVVPVDHPAVKIVQVGCRKAAAFQRNQGAQIRRNHRQHGQHHPLRTALGLDKALVHLDALGQFLANLLAARLGHGLLQLINTCLQIDQCRRIMHRLRTHLGHESVRAVGVPCIAELHLGE